MTNESEERKSLVVASYGHRLELCLSNGDRVPARVKGRRLRPVCGDRVLARPLDTEGDWLITGILPRKNELTRPDQRKRTDILAANVSLLAVVTAPLPKPDWFIVDRYLAAAELMGANAVVVYNKADLPAANEPDVLEYFRRIGYPTVVTSAEDGSGIDSLRALLRNETAIFVGQSGVGKSTLINCLRDDEQLKTASISPKTGEGKHTTVNSVMRTLEGGGAVIDSPGVRDYAPAIGSVDQVVLGFREIAATGRDCRFANCRHLREPACAVKSAVDSGGISTRRYESYRRLLRLTENLADQH